MRSWCAKESITQEYVKGDADCGRILLPERHVGRYLAQAAEYSNTNAPFGQLLVLDLTPKSDTQGFGVVV
jgi:hypothetical protein